MKNKIIVPTDFTKAAGQAVKQAVSIARKSGSSLTLFHVLNERKEDQEDIIKRLNKEAENISRHDGITCEVLVKEGNIFETIPFMVCEKDYDFMVIGTHGFMGIRQMLFGTDILKLVAKIPIPVMVVQEDSPLVESFHKILLPIGSHDTFSLAAEVVLLIAGMYDVEVHLYSIHKPGFEWTDQLLANIGYAERKFEENGVHMIRIKEEQEGFSLGYARQTLKYAQSIDADIMLMMSVASEELHSFAQAYKETMLLNEFHLPVLCVGGGPEN
jgi:nucleotide-binding universal stress UspA family protein